MQDYHLPFEYITVQDVRQAVSHYGQTLSLMDACGFFLCQRGSVEVSLDDKTFNIHQGDVYFYMPSTFVSVLKYSDDVEGIAVRYPFRRLRQSLVAYKKIGYEIYKQQLPGAQVALLLYDDRYGEKDGGDCNQDYLFLQPAFLMFVMMLV